MTRLYVAGARIHHGPVGLLLALLGVAIKRPFLATAGLAILADDWRDFPWLR